MKRYDFSCLWIIAFYLLAACSPVLKEKTFPQEYRLTSERIALGRFFEPWAMELKEGFLIFLSNNTLYFYSVSDHCFTQTLNTKYQPVFKTPQIIRSSLPYLYIMDVNNKNEIRKYTINDLGEPVLLQAGYAGINSSMNRPYILQDSLILYDECVPEASLKIHDLHTNETAQTLPYGATSMDDRFFDINLGGLYANDSCIAFAYKYQDRIDFYDWQFNLIKSVNNQKTEPIVYKKNYLENVHYYGNSYMGKNYFYTLYRGVTNKVFRSDSLQAFKEMYDYGIIRDVLEVYDLNGTPVSRFRFHDVAPSVFVVDEEHNVLIGHKRAYLDSLLIYNLHGLPKNGKKYAKTKNRAPSFLPVTTPPDDPSEVVQFRRGYGLIEDHPIYYVYTTFIPSGLVGLPGAREAVFSPPPPSIQR